MNSLRVIFSVLSLQSPVPSRIAPASLKYPPFQAPTDGIVAYVSPPERSGVSCGTYPSFR
jgi:hypothetical protein